MATVSKVTTKGEMHTTGGTPNTERESPACLIGNVGATPELCLSPTGKAVVSFSLALYAGKTTSGEKLTEWVKIRAWGELAEVISKTITKGDKVRASGYLLLDKWEGAYGEPMSRIDLTAFKVEKLPRPPAGVRP